MAYDETLAEEVRKSLSGFTVEEKKAFGGLAFMINQKMCVSVNNKPDHIMMIRVDPNNKELLSREGAKVAVMRGKEMRGWIFLTKKAIITPNDFDFWIKQALHFNKELTK